jgi:hypothetical protein
MIKTKVSALAQSWPLVWQSNPERESSQLSINKKRIKESMRKKETVIRKMGMKHSSSLGQKKEKNDF